MSESLASWIVAAAAVYLGLGFLFAVPFVLFGARRVDPRAVGGSWGFKLAILPATMALWPLMARRWARGGGPPEERNPHRDQARASEGGR